MELYRSMQLSNLSAAICIHTAGGKAAHQGRRQSGGDGRMGSGFSRRSVIAAGAAALASRAFGQVAPKADGAPPTFPTRPPLTGPQVAPPEPPLFPPFPVVGSIEAFDPALGEL